MINIIKYESIYMLIYLICSLHKMKKYSKINKKIKAGYQPKHFIDR
jgi:hypothetical protein